MTTRGALSPARRLAYQRFADAREDDKCLSSRYLEASGHREASGIGI
jgi:hypothetical protein